MHDISFLLARDPARRFEKSTVGERRPKTTGPARRSAACSAWPVSGLMRAYQAGLASFPCECTVGIGQILRIYRCGGSAGFAVLRTGLPVSPDRVSRTGTKMNLKRY